MKQKKPTYAELEERVRRLEARLSDEKVAWDILRILAAAWDAEGPPGIVDNRDLLARAGITASEAIPWLQRMGEAGVIDKDQAGYASYLTTDGYELARNGTARHPISDQISAMRAGVVAGRGRTPGD